jgi:hypothetical protein
MNDDQLMKMVLYELRQLRASILVLAAIIAQGRPSIGAWEIGSNLNQLSERAEQLAAERGLDGVHPPGL